MDEVFVLQASDRDWYGSVGDGKRVEGDSYRQLPTAGGNKSSPSGQLPDDRIGCLDGMKLAKV